MLGQAQLRTETTKANFEMSERTSRTFNESHAAVDEDTRFDCVCSFVYEI